MFSPAARSPWHAARVFKQCAGCIGNVPFLQIRIVECCPRPSVSIVYFVLFSPPSPQGWGRGSVESESGFRKMCLPRWNMLGARGQKRFAGNPDRSHARRSLFLQNCL